MSIRHVFRWDLDKTYLRTEFDGFRALLRTALESAKEKRAVPGAAALLRAIRREGGQAHRISIISGSPRQMRKVLMAKLAMDGVQYDEFVLKPNLSNVLRGRFRALRQQVPYKLPALLSSRIGTAELAPAAAETLFGDDAESDAIIYSLYTDILAGRVGEKALAGVLEAVGAYDDQKAETLELARKAPRADVVGRIIINLDQRTPISSFERFGPRLIPIYNYFQAALILHADGQLSARGVLEAASEMVASGEFKLGALANSLQELVRRGRLSRETARRLADEAYAIIEAHPKDFEKFPPLDEIRATFSQRVRALGDSVDDRLPEPRPLDYVALIRSETDRRQRSRSTADPLD